MDVHILTLFPEVIEAYTSASIMGRAQEKELVRVWAHDLRLWTDDKHKTVDDEPYGGGPGMVLKVEPIYKAVQEIKSKAEGKIRTVLFSTRGSVLNNAHAQRLSEYDILILIAGRYEGVDERVAQHVADEEISLGDFVLSGGEIPAMAIVDAVARKIPGVLGKKESLEEIKGSYPVYTRPEQFETERGAWGVPDVLLSGDHKKIQKWREQNG